MRGVRPSLEGMDGSHDMNLWGLAGMIGGLAFWLLVIGLAVWLVSSRSQPRPATSALFERELLERRLASGEIGVEEYDKRRAALQGRSAP